MALEETEPGLKAALCQLWRSEPVKRIDFSLGRLVVNEDMFEAVATALQNDEFVAEKISAGAGHTVYDNAEDWLGVPTYSGSLTGGTNVSIAALMVHEAVHAWCDMIRAAPNNPYAEEVVGYIAQSVYAAHRRGVSRNPDYDPALDPSRYIGGRTQSEDLIFQEVVELAHRKDLFAGGVHLVRSDIRDAMDAVRHCRLYARYGDATRSEHHDGLIRRRMSCGFFGTSRCQPGDE